MLNVAWTPSADLSPKLRLIGAAADMEALAALFRMLSLHPQGRTVRLADEVPATGDDLIMSCSRDRRWQLRRHGIQVLWDFSVEAAMDFTELTAPLATEARRHQYLEDFGSLDAVLVSSGED